MGGLILQFHHSVKDAPPPSDLVLAIPSHPSITRASFCDQQADLYYPLDVPHPASLQSLVLVLCATCALLVLLVRDLRSRGILYHLLLTTGHGSATALINEGTRLGGNLYLPACEGVSRVLVL